MRNRTNRSSGRVIEALERRQLMAIYAAADYFPLAPNQTWIYEATVNNESTTDTRTSTPVRLNDVSVTRIRDLADVEGNNARIDRYFKHDGRGGLRDFKLEFEGEGFVEGSIEAAQSIRLLPQTFDVGRVSRWRGAAVTGHIEVPSVSFSSEQVDGFESGTVNVTPIAVEQQAGHTFVNVINVQIRRQQNYTEEILGQTFKITVDISESWHLAKGVGLISGSTTLGVKISGGFNLDYDDSLTETMKLTSSTLLQPFTRVSGTTLRVGGTTGDDVISAELDGTDILITRNGVEDRTLAAGITRVVIDASTGNDSVGPLDLGAMRSVLIGGDGADNLMGGLGREIIYGGNGNDTLVGANRSDTLIGEAGDDIFNGGGSADSIDGGFGNDTARNDLLDTRLSIEVVV